MVAELTVAFFLMMVSIVAAVAYWFWSREALPVTAQGPSAATRNTADDTLPPNISSALRLLARAGEHAPSNEEERTQLRRDLAAAGIRDDWAVQVMIGARAVFAGLLPLFTFVLFYTLNPDFWMVLPAALLSGYLGYRLPNQYVRRLIESRKLKIQQGLPDLLDLLVISVDSGLSLDHALSDTARDLNIVHPVISEELGVFQMEVRAGTSRAEALRNLGLRSREPEMRKLTSLLIQADRFGTSIAKILRTQARYMRIRRRQRAEELAHKVGVKMIFPIFLLIMPSVFVVTAGPAVLQLFLSFRNIANSF
jgi:tight adherence protein C